jgi:hypothetical protein
MARNCLPRDLRDRSLVIQEVVSKPALEVADESWVFEVAQDDEIEQQ